MSSISRSTRMVQLLAVILFASSTWGLQNCLPHFSQVVCPPDDDIYPCECHGDEFITDVFCDNMTSEVVVRHTLKNFTDPIPELVITQLHSSSLPLLALRKVQAKILRFLDGNIRVIDEFAFYGQDSLSKLYLDRNKLEDIPTEALQDLAPSLEILSMSGNIFAGIPDGSLSNLVHLADLTLSENRISEIGKDAFPKNLRILQIWRNLLSTFNGSLQGNHIKGVNASYNRFTSIKGEFDGIVSLGWLNLDYNHISNISDSFSNLGSIYSLSLAGYEIREDGEALTHLKHLRYLNLSHNAITNLKEAVFDNMEELGTLDLSGNFLKDIEICPAIRSVGSLFIIKLSNSGLKTLPSDCFDNNTKLQSVDISRNQLSALGLTHATKLAILDIRCNNFRFLDTLDLPTYGSATLILEDNPWWISKETTSGLKNLGERGYFVSPVNVNTQPAFETVLNPKNF